MEQLLGKYSDWFKPKALRDASNMGSMLSNFEVPKTEDDAYLQIVSYARYLAASPSMFVQSVAQEIQRNPDGIVTKFLAKCYFNLVNPLDFIVWLHSPKAIDMFGEAGIDVAEMAATNTVHPSIQPKLVVI
jgi:hypothetical protein